MPLVVEPPGLDRSGFDLFQFGQAAGPERLHEPRWSRDLKRIGMVFAKNISGIDLGT